MWSWLLQTKSTSAIGKLADRYLSILCLSLKHYEFLGTCERSDVLSLIDVVACFSLSLLSTRHSPVYRIGWCFSASLLCLALCFFFCLSWRRRSVVINRSRHSTRSFSMRMQRRVTSFFKPSIRWSLPVVEMWHWSVGRRKARSAVFLNSILIWRRSHTSHSWSICVCSMSNGSIEIFRPTNWRRWNLIFAKFVSFVVSWMSQISSPMRTFFKLSSTSLTCQSLIFERFFDRSNWMSRHCNSSAIKPKSRSRETSNWLFAPNSIDFMPLSIRGTVKLSTKPNDKWFKCWFSVRNLLGRVSWWNSTFRSYWVSALSKDNGWSTPRISRMWNKGWMFSARGSWIAMPAKRSSMIKHVYIEIC